MIISATIDSVSAHTQHHRPNHSSVVLEVVNALGEASVVLGFRGPQAAEKAAYIAAAINAANAMGEKHEQA